MKEIWAKVLTKIPMFDQFGKIIDTRTGPKPVTTVTTDDGEKVQVNPQQAQEPRNLLRWME